MFLAFIGASLVRRSLALKLWHFIEKTFVYTEATNQIVFYMELGKVYIYIYTYHGTSFSELASERIKSCVLNGPNPWSRNYLL